MENFEKNIQNFKKEINEDFSLILLCRLNHFNVEVIDIFLSVYKKKSEYSEIYTCSLMYFFIKYDFQMLNLLLKHGFDINSTIYYKNKEYNLFFYLLDIKCRFCNYDITYLLTNGIDINAKLKFNLNDISLKCNITDLLITKISNRNYYKVLTTIFEYYLRKNENISLLKKNINDLNENSYENLIFHEHNQLETIKIFILYCYFSKEEFYSSIFYKNLKEKAIKLHKTKILNTIEEFYSQNKEELEELEKKYDHIKIKYFYKLKDYKNIKNHLDNYQDNINEIKIESEPLLLYASHYCINDTKMFDLLLSYNLNKNIFDDYHCTALHIACQNNNYKIIPKLITEKNINMKNINGDTPLLVAILENSYECIKALLSNGTNIDTNVIDSCGYFSLKMILIIFNNSPELIELINLLINNGVDKNLHDSDQSTALHKACQLNTYEVIPKLITEENINMKDKNGNTPLMIAIQEKNYESIKALLSNEISIDTNVIDSNDNSSLINILNNFHDFKGLSELIDSVIKNGADRDFVNKNKSTALHSACQYNTYEAIPKLITENNINLKDINGDTPLMIAIQEKNYESIKALLSNEISIDTNVIDSNGNSSLINILNNSQGFKGLSELIDSVIKNGANRDFTNKDKSTALHIACQYNTYEVISKLITEKNINMKDKNCNIPLIVAYKKKHKECIVELLSNPFFNTYYKKSANLINVMLYLLDNKVESEIVYEVLILNNVCFGLKQFKKQLNNIINNQSFVRAIIKNGFYIHKSNKMEHINKPLIFSISNNFIDLTKSILKNYSSSIIDEVDENNKYCLFYAIDNDNEDYFDLLIKSKKINIEKDNGKGMTPLEYTLKLKKDNMVKLLLKEYIDKFEEGEEECDKNVLKEVVDTKFNEIYNELLTKLKEGSRIDYQTIKQIIDSFNNNSESNEYNSEYYYELNYLPLLVSSNNYNKKVDVLNNNNNNNRNNKKNKSNNEYNNNNKNNNYYNNKKNNKNKNKNKYKNNKKNNKSSNNNNKYNYNNNPNNNNINNINDTFNKNNAILESALNKDNNIIEITSENKSIDQFNNSNNNLNIINSNEEYLNTDNKSNSHEDYLNTKIGNNSNDENLNNENENYENSENEEYLNTDNKSNSNEDYLNTKIGNNSNDENLNNENENNENSENEENLNIEMENNENEESFNSEIENNENEESLNIEMENSENKESLNIEMENSENKEDLNAEDRNNPNEQYNSNEVKSNVEKEITINESLSDYNEMYIACLNDNKDLIKILIEFGYDINEQQCDDGSTPLLFSLKYEKYISAKTLIENNANILIPDKEGETPLSYVIRNLSEKNNNNYEILELLLLSININEIDSDGNSILLSIIKKDSSNLELIEKILMCGADVNQLDKENRNPLIYAIEKEDINLINLLIKYKADIQFKMPNGMTPIKLACIKNNTDIVKEILNAKKKIV